MRTWAELVSADEARRRFAAAWTPRIRTEEIPTEEALGRVLATPILSPEDLPPFSRALMDGFACRAADLQGAPVELAVLGEVLMGGRAPVPVRPGGAIQIPTGGMLPEGADVVVPIEQTEAAGDRVRVLTELAAGRHCIARGEDVAQGQELLPQERRLRSADVGALIGLGILQVLVYARPVVGILATGDEIVPPAATPQPGQVRDLNSYALAAAIQGLGAIPRRLGIIPDDLDALRAAARAGLESSDLLLVSAGSSVGARDLAAGVIQELGEPGVLVHGVDIRPGKPTIFALCSGKPVFGLPGQPVSVLNTFDQFVAPVLRRLLHHSTPPPTVSARLAEAIRSADGREDHVRVALEERSDGWWAHPILGVSAMITTMTRADGMTVIPAGTPGVAAGETVTVRLLV